MTSKTDNKDENSLEENINIDPDTNTGEVNVDENGDEDGDGKLDEFGEILHENWVLKQSLTNQISNSEIEKYYQIGIESGAIGGKLLGAGGGGFLLFYVHPEKRDLLSKALSELYPLSIKFDKNAPTPMTWSYVCRKV